MEEKPNYYAVIPANVRYDKNLKDKAKLLYGEITALSNEKGYCWATNEYFANLYDVTTRTITDLISNLSDSNYIKSEIVTKDNKSKRIIKIAEGRKNLLGGIEENFQEGIEENFQHNNTSINNIYEYYENVYTRTLNAIEYETLNRWQKQKSIEEIKSAINQTAKAGIDNLKYVEKVLFSNKKKKDGWDDDYWNE